MQGSYYGTACFLHNPTVGLAGLAKVTTRGSVVYLVGGQVDFSDASSALYQYHKHNKDRN